MVEDLRLCDLLLEDDVTIDELVSVGALLHYHFHDRYSCAFAADVLVHPSGIRIRPTDGVSREDGKRISCSASNLGN